MLKQLEIIKMLKKNLSTNKDIETAILYGSFARKTASVNSDVDIAIIVNKAFDAVILLNEIKEYFSTQISLAINVELRNKIVLYPVNLTKIEIAYFQNLNEIERNYLGSEIPFELIPETVLFDKTDLTLNYLQLITTKKIQTPNSTNETKALNLINKFIYEFESCSNAHRRSDGYQFYFFYNIALNCVIQLRHLLFPNNAFNFFPKYFIPNLQNKNEMEEIYKLNGTLFLPEANIKKRKLLDYFFKVIELHNIQNINQLQSFLEYIFERDFFWNFRDIATHNPKIKKGIIFRTATLSVFQENPELLVLLKKMDIKTIIDLRADREIKELPYSKNILTGINYIKASFDPWNQPDWFKQKYNFGTNEEIAYRFFILGCKTEIKNAIRAIISENEGAVAIHCFAGKDRTGIFVTLLHLLTVANNDIIETDYLASEVDVKLYRLEFVIEIINENGGIISYLKSCGLELDEILSLKNKLTNE